MAEDWTSIRGGVTTPLGFRASAVDCGIKDPDKRRLDLALITSDTPVVAAATFTTNRVKAAPIRVSAEHLRHDEVQAIIANSGNANACTGPQGIKDAKQMAKSVAKALNLRQRQVMVCSTGMIGLPMPMDRIDPMIPKLVEGLAPTKVAGTDVAAAIMTSDTRSKEVAVKFKLGGKEVRIGACAKGAGMIDPNMATMLSFVTTDAELSKAELKRATTRAVEKSFNRITIDGDMSTNDTVIVFANGASGAAKIKSGSNEAEVFTKALTYVLIKLAKLLVSDGERVTKFVDICVRGASSYHHARMVAEAVAKSSLCKCSWNGEDANWGRIMDAVGYSGARIREELIDIYFDGVAATRNGMAAGTPVSKLRAVVKKQAFTINIDLHLGEANYNVFTSDLSPEYVEFNRSEYSMWKRAQGDTEQPAAE